jgi:restriction system protein
MIKAGYEYLLAYKITVPIYDYTVKFCDRYIGKYSRLYEQITQAARSGMQNISEGNKEKSLENYIKLTGIARGSQEELLKDFLSFARQKKIPIWPKEKVYREIREIRIIWEILRKTPYLPDSPNFPPLPNSLEQIVNLMITLINQANYLIDKLIASLEQKFINEGGFRENLFKKRLEEKNKNKR